MSGSSSDLESTHSSQCDSEYNDIPGYIIEDESNYTSHKIGTLEAVDSEILGDYDACLYADEPLGASRQRMIRTISKTISRTQATKRDATAKIRWP
jgi:hypothetical protein